MIQAILTEPFGEKSIIKLHYHQFLDHLGIKNIQTYLESLTESTINWQTISINLRQNGKCI